MIMTLFHSTDIAFRKRMTRILTAITAIGKDQASSYGIMDETMLHPYSHPSTIACEKVITRSEKKRSEIIKRAQSESIGRINAKTGIAAMLIIIPAKGTVPKVLEIKG